MDRGRLKTFVLLLLVIVNLAFLGIIISERVEEHRLQRDAKETLIEVLDSLGIVIDYDAIAETGVQTTYRLNRNVEAEQELVMAILGQAEQLDEGGGIYSYESSEGSALYRTSEFSFQLSSEAARLSEGIADTGKLVLNKMEITGRETAVEGDESSGFVSYMLLFDDCPVVNGQITFSFEGGYLREIEGTSLLGERQRVASSEQLDVTTALIKLAGYLADNTQVSRFDSVEMGYYLTEGSGFLELAPVWIVQTDGGIYSVDRQSGDIK